MTTEQPHEHADGQSTILPTPPSDPAQVCEEAAPEQPATEQNEQGGPEKDEQPTAGKRSRPAFTITEASERTSVSRSTIRRRRESGGFPNAFKRNGEWVIPVEDLVAAGLKVRAPGGEQPVAPEVGSPRPTTPEQPAQSPRMDMLTEPAHLSSEQARRLREDNQNLRVELEVERAQRHAYEQIAAERERGLNDMRMAMRMLEVGPSARGKQEEWGSRVSAGGVAADDSRSVGVQWETPPESPYEANAGSGPEERESQDGPGAQAGKGRVNRANEQDVKPTRGRRSFRDWIAGR